MSVAHSTRTGRAAFLAAVVDVVRAEILDRPGVGAGVRDRGPVPAGWRSSVPELVVEHLPHPIEHDRLARVGVIGQR